MISADNTAELQATFKALADPTRRKIIDLLGEEEKTVGEVARHFDITRAAVKKHLLVLEEGRIVVSEHRGRETLNRLEPLALKDAADWLGRFEAFWDARLTALRHAVEREAQKKDTK